MSAPGRLGEVVLVWHVDRARQGTVLWGKLIADGWEPFAVTQDAHGGFLYHLRKQVPVLGHDDWSPVGPTS